MTSASGSTPVHPGPGPGPEEPPASAPSFTYHPSLEPFNIPPQTYLSANPHLTDLAVSAVLFDTPLNQFTPSAEKPPNTRTLLIQRAATDSSPLYWECPGGGVELGSHSHSPSQPSQVHPPNPPKGLPIPVHEHKVSTEYYEEEIQQGAPQPDRTILTALSREILEETGLHLTRVEALIDDTCEFGNKKGTVRARKLTFLVDFGRPFQTTETETDRSSTDNRVDAAKVVLNPAEHQDVIWATEEEILASEIGHVANEGQGRKITFAFEDQRDRILAAFRILKEKARESS